MHSDNKNQNKFNIIIPMAGEGSRFGYQFKPFLKLDNRTFIEHVLDSFREIDVETYNFIVTEQQEETNRVTDHLRHTLFPGISDKINVIKIREKTMGPYQTIMAAMRNARELKNVIICDSDHFVDILPITQKVELDSNLDIVVPVWNIDNEEQKNWGKIVLDSRSRSILHICEKEILPPTEGETIYGILGCYYFSSTAHLIQDGKYLHFSDFLKENYKKYDIDIAFMEKALFFGTPEMAKKTVELRRKWETVICDVDGVLIEHKNHSTDLAEDNRVISDCADKIKKWRRQNKKVILATARPKNTRESFEKNLKRLGIVYDDIIMGLNPGPRYLINDLKPSNPFVRQALSINLPRGEGIDDLNLEESQNYDIETVEVFRGNSFSKTFLLKDKDDFYVRKQIVKNKNSVEHYEKLKRQLEDLKRYAFYDQSLVPKILNEKDDVYDYYFDMEYLEGYGQLDEFDSFTQFKILDTVVDKLANKVYCYNKINEGDSFITNFFDTKIYPKLGIFEKECPTMKYLINNKTVRINDKDYYGLREILKRLNVYNFNTEYVSPIHGDLTLENILYNSSTRDFKLIDMDGSRYMDSCYFDLGKIFQSIVSNYREWSILQDVVFSCGDNEVYCVDKYFHCIPTRYKNICEKYAHITGNNNSKDVFRKGIFYMAMYFIRFVPFRRQISNEHGIFAMIMAINWLNYLYED